MALQMTVIDPKSKLTVTDSYIRIDHIDGNKDALTIRVSAYNTVESVKYLAFEIKPETENDNFFGFNPSTDEGSDNFIKQGYEYLKTLSQFSSAIDV